MKRKLKSPKRKLKRERKQSDDELIILEDVEIAPRRRFDMHVKFVHHNHIKSESGQEYPIIRKIGEGVYGNVFLTHYDERHCAIKVLKEHLENLKPSFKLEKKMNMLISQDPHEHLVRTERCGKLYSTLEFCSPYYFLMELLGPSVFDVMRVSKPHNQNAVFRNSDIARVGDQILSGAQRLEELGLVHLDLKPENVYFSSESDHDGVEKENGTYFIKMLRIHVKIGDFGCAREYSKESPPTVGELVQTQNYRAPEIFMGVPFSPKSDVWSIGCILAEMYIGDLIFYGNSDEDTEAVQFAMMNRVVGQAPTPWMWREAWRVPTKKVEMTEEGEIFMIAQAKDHVFTRQLAYNHRDDDPEIELFDLLHSLFRIDPRTRPSFEEARRHQFFAS